MSSFMQFFGSPNVVCLLFFISYSTIPFILPWFSIEHFVNSVFKGAI